MTPVSNKRDSLPISENSENQDGEEVVEKNTQTHSVIYAGKVMKVKDGLLKTKINFLDSMDKKSIYRFFDGQWWVLSGDIFVAPDPVVSFDLSQAFTFEPVGSFCDLWLKNSQ